MSLRRLIERSRQLLETGVRAPLWTGTYGSHPGMNRHTDYRPLRDRDDSQLPFRSKAAERIYSLARDLVIDHPLLPAESIVRHAIDQTDYANDLTSEDIKLLVMGVEFLQNGPPPASARRGGQREVEGTPQEESLPYREQLREYISGPRAPGTRGTWSGGHSLPSGDSHKIGGRRGAFKGAPADWIIAPEDLEEPEVVDEWNDFIQTLLTLNLEKRNVRRT